MKDITARVCLLFFICVSTTVASRQPLPNIYSVHRQHNHLTNGHHQTLTQSQFARSGVTSLSEALINMAGLSVHNTSGTNSASLSMRGFGDNGSSNVLTLINGIPLTNSDLMPPDLNAIPIEDIREVEITSGSESVLYGDQAVGGVINILTDTEHDKRVRAQCSVGSYDLRECRVGLNNYWGALNYHISGTQKITDNYRNNNDSLTNTLFTTANYSAGANTVALIYKFSYQNMQYPGALTATQVRANRRQANNITDFFRDKTQFLHVKLTRPFSDTLKFTTDISVRHMDGNGVLSAEFTQGRQSLFVKPMLRKQTDTLAWINGVDTQFDSYHLSSPFGLTKNRQKRASAFTLAKYTKNHARVSAGLRLAAQSTLLQTISRASTINRAFASTLGVSYLIADATKLYARRVDNYRFPKAEENTQGNTPLRTQRGTSYETGVEYEKNTNALSLSLFQLNLRDEIAFDPLQTPQNPFGTNRNLAKTQRTGLSLSGKTSLRHVNVDGQINYVNARFNQGVKSGKHIPLVSDMIARAGIQYKLDKHWSAYAESVFTSRQFPANDDLNITGGLGGYTVYNVNLRYQAKSLSVSLRVNNVANKQYYLYSIYQTNMAGMATEFFYPAAERNVVLIVSYAVV